MKFNKAYIYVAAIVIVVLIVIAIYFYRKGKKSVKGVTADYPKGGADIPATWSPLPLVKELYDAMSGGGTLSGTKDAVWTKLKDLPTDEMVIAVYNVFNQNYAEESETLTSWISHEYYYDFFSGIKAATLDRLRSLNLS